MWPASTRSPRARRTATSIARFTSDAARVRLYSAEPRISDCGSATARSGFDRRAIVFCRRPCCPRRASSAVFRFDRNQSHTTQDDCHILTDFAVHRELHCRTGGRIDRRRTLERQVSSAAALRRNLDHNLAHQFIVRKHRGVGILDEIGKPHPPITLALLASHFCFERHKDGGPVSAGIGFRQRSADSASVAHLHVGDARGAVMNDRNVARLRSNARSQHGGSAPRNCNVPFSSLM